MAEHQDQTQVTRFFEKHSANYADFFKEQTRTGSALMFRTRMQIVAELLRGAEGALLDCATGTGEITQAVNLSGRYSRVCANDISEGMLSVARKQISAPAPGQDLQFINSDVFAIDEVEGVGKFDVILCLGLIAHVGRVNELFALFERLVQPGGRVALQTSIASHPGARLARLVNDRRVATGGLHKIHYFDVPEIVESANGAGFELTAERRFGVGFPFGDKLLGPFNHMLESSLSSMTAKHGSDAVFIFQRAA